MAEPTKNQDYLEEAMAALADLDAMCKLLLLRVEQMERRAPFLDGLVSPMHEEIVYVMHGIRKAQEAHSLLWSRDFMKIEA